MHFYKNILSYPIERGGGAPYFLMSWGRQTLMDFAGRNKTYCYIQMLFSNSISNYKNYNFCLKEKTSIPIKKKNICI